MFVYEWCISYVPPSDDPNVYEFSLRNGVLINDELFISSLQHFVVMFRIPLTRLDLCALLRLTINVLVFILGHGETSWCFSQVKGALNDDITDADVISCVEFNHDGDLLATGDKGGRVVIFQVSLQSHDAVDNRDQTPVLILERS